MPFDSQKTDRGKTMPGPEPSAPSPRLLVPLRLRCSRGGAVKIQKNRPRLNGSLARTDRIAGKLGAFDELDPFRIVRSTAQSLASVASAPGGQILAERTGSCRNSRLPVADDHQKLRQQIDRPSGCGRRWRATNTPLSVQREESAMFFARILIATTLIAAAVMPSLADAASAAGKPSGDQEHADCQPAEPSGPFLWQHRPPRTPASQRLIAFGAKAIAGFSLATDRPRAICVYN